MEEAKQITAIKEWLGAGSIDIFGIQLSGKDTQATKLAELFDGHMISSGQLSRQSNDAAVKSANDQGNLIPSEAFIRMVVPYLNRQEFSGQPLILSSVGRWIGEEQGVLKAASESGHPLKAVLLIKLSEADVWKRWQLLQKHDDRGHRKDDTEEGLQKRLEEFHNKTLPVIEVYRKKGLVIDIDGNQPRDAVTKDILTALYKRADKENS